MTVFQTLLYSRPAACRLSIVAMTAVIAQPARRGDASPDDSPRYDMDESPRKQARRGAPSENTQSSWKAFAAGKVHIDHLARLYPHARDSDCTMDEISHTYHVHGERYPCSVSGVWKVFFPVFDQNMAERSMRSAESKGIKHMESSAYNLVQYLSLYERLEPNDEVFWERARSAVANAEEQYALAGWHRSWNAAQAVSCVRAMAAQAKKPPVKERCYFLALCAGCTPERLRRMWATGGELESFKGTYLHKQAELFMQELGAWQLEQGVDRVPLRVVLEEDPRVLARARESCCPENTMAALVAHVPNAVWDHPGTQAFLADMREKRRSPEYLRFEAWLRANPALSPYRSEWSIYNEDHRVAGQVDSLWFDTNRQPSQEVVVVMADWKRAKELLTSDPVEQRRRSYGKTGLRDCAAAPGVPGPCAEMMDCSYNHYLAQQNLYAHFLRVKYDVVIHRMVLVQCHPDVGTTDASFNEAVLEQRTDFAADLLAAFVAGWKELL